jgi:hypothetical protein
MFTPAHPPRTYTFTANNRSTMIRTAYGLDTAQKLAAKNLDAPAAELVACYCPIKGHMRIVDGFPMNR